MENAVEALKMAAFMLLFVGALTIAVFSLTQARVASQQILAAKEEERSTSFVEENKYIESATTYKTSRTVKLDSIIPTLYRYYKENYRVEFDFNGRNTPLYTNTQGVKIYALDLDDEMKTNEPWRGSTKATKENVDKIVQQVLLRHYEGSEFIEDLGIEPRENNTDSALMEDINKQTKRTIRYTLI